MRGHLLETEVEIGEVEVEITEIVESPEEKQRIKTLVDAGGNGPLEFECGTTEKCRRVIRRTAPTAGQA
jgi:hypothetical protein